MLKHLPEGLVPFEDCGFARHPLMPLAMEPVRVDCRVDEEDGRPALLLCVDGGTEREIAPEGTDGRYYHFLLGGFALGQKICYRIVTRDEESAGFTFEPLRERRISQPRAILEDENRLHALFDGFAVTFSRAEGALCMEAHTRPVSGLPCETAQWMLEENLSLVLAQQEPFCQLKRLSKIIFSIDRYILRETASGCIASLRLEGQLPARYVWGMGERFDRVNQREGGSNGRVVEKFTRQGNQTYLPIPFFMSETGLGWYCEGDIPAELNFADGLSVARRTQGETLSRDRLFFGAPAQMLQHFIRLTGEPVLPPEWAFGLWISANGWNCDREVDAQLAALKAHDYPADVMVLEAWSDEQTFYRWNGDGSWKDPAATVRRIRENGLHLVLWQIPVIKYEWNGAPCEALRNDEREAIEKGYCVKNADGTPYRITENWFHHSLLLDFTNPDAVRWWFEKRKYLLDMGVEGFKTDGGEFLFPQDARLHDGTDGLSGHNRYPARYVGAYHDFLRANGVAGVTFSRADFTGAQTRPLHWAGDQLSLWSELQAQLVAGLSAGLSGILFWGFDIGGFAGELPTAELYLRATAMACFCPVMQWHAEPRSGQFYATHEDGFNNDRSPWNLAEKLGAPKLMDIAVGYARLRRRLQPYLTREAAHCVAACRPMMAHLCLDFAGDERALKCEDQYMLGRDLLVAPIVEEGAKGRAVWLPKGMWREYFTGERLSGNQEIYVECPLERIPVYERMRTDE